MLLLTLENIIQNLKISMRLCVSVLGDECVHNDCMKRHKVKRQQYDIEQNSFN